MANFFHRSEYINFDLKIYILLHTEVAANAVWVSFVARPLELQRVSAKNKPSYQGRINRRDNQDFYGRVLAVAIVF